MRIQLESFNLQEGSEEFVSVRRSLLQLGVVAIGPATIIGCSRRTRTGRLT
jgi:hypothetical protein